jgi:hypothetical protein
MAFHRIAAGCRRPFEFFLTRFECYIVVFSYIEQCLSSVAGPSIYLFFFRFFEIKSNTNVVARQCVYDWAARGEWRQWCSLPFVEIQASAWFPGILSLFPSFHFFDVHILYIYIYTFNSFIYFLSSLLFFPVNLSCVFLFSLSLSHSRLSPYLLTFYVLHILQFSKCVDI